MPSKTTLRFLGAAECVTGSKYQLHLPDCHLLIDCGLFQGEKHLRLKNWQPLNIDIKTLDAVILTHAHIDHSGALPLLVKQGYSGPIYCTPGTKDLCEIMLLDSAHLQEEAAHHANEHNYSKHHPALPLYTVQDAKAALNLFCPIALHQAFKLSPLTSLTLTSAGHIIGASCVHIHHKDKTIVFSGDLGRPNDEMMKPPTPIMNADYLVIESTYGDRLHETESVKTLLQTMINKTVKRQGTLLIPAFAVGRTQTLLHYLFQLKQEEAISNVPIYLDSPMAIQVTKLARKHTKDLRIAQSEYGALMHLPIPTPTPQESMALNKDETSKIIIAGSGMVSGGRILFHLKHYGPDPKNAVLLTGFQAAGTRGADLLKGANQLKIQGQLIPIRAEINAIRSASAHADYAEILAFLSHFKSAPKQTFITHGELPAAYALKEKIEAQLHWPCMIPKEMQTETLR